MIGLFDSGYGGLAITRELIKQYPNFSYRYLGDNARAPYGVRSKEEILDFTIQGVDFLLTSGCPLVILACNTSSANALRTIQQEYLPKKWPDRKVLGIIVPTVEQMTGTAWEALDKNHLRKEVIGVLATPMTVASEAYTVEILKRAPNMTVVEQACPTLVPLIEQGLWDEANAELEIYIHELEEKMKSKQISWPPDAILLGCTHYELLANHLRTILPPIVKLYLQSHIVAASLKEYLSRHPEIADRLNREGKREYFTTADPELVSNNAKIFMDPAPEFQQITLQ
ncbi:MAG: glutamate racemase [Patescibacteria group bacterium]|jgi:glutamate racemase